MENSLQGKTLLLVHSGDSGKRFVVHKLKKFGLKIVCLNREKVPSLESYVDHWILADLSNDKECIEGVRSFIKTHPNVKIDGALSFWEPVILLASKITDAFSWIGVPFQIGQITKNKYLFREFCNQNGIRAPRHKLFFGDKNITQIEKYVSYPLVMKPVYGAASLFVIKVESRQEVEETYEYIKNTIKSNVRAQEWVNMDLLVEEYIDGDEVDIDIILQNGKIKFYTISDNFNKSRDRFFVDSGQGIPSSLPEKDQKALIDMAEETLEKLGIQNSIIHFEAKISKGIPYPIEVNMRMGGDYIYSYIKGAWGVDFIEYSAKIALGIYIKIDKLAAPKKYIVGWDLQPENSGILVELDVDEALKEKDFFGEIHFFKEIGDAILRPPEGYDSLGWLTVSGENPLDAQDNLREALKHVRYKVAEFDDESYLGKTDRKDRLSVAMLKKNKLIQAAKIEKVRHLSLNDQRKLRIGIAANLGEKDLVNNMIVAQKIDNLLRKKGYITSIFDFNNFEKSFSKFLSTDIDLVLNICEGVNNDELLKSQSASLFEILHVPFTGTSSHNLELCRDKIRMKKLFSYHDVPTAKWDYARNLSQSINEDLQFPLIVKPADADNSIGISNNSVVINKAQLDKQLKNIIVDLGRPALVEEYIEGDEYSVFILGNSNEDLRVLPLSRSIFTRMPKGYWHIYTRESILNPNLKSSQKITVQNPARHLSKKLESLLSEIAIDAYKIMQCRDYGQVEIRVDKEGNPYVLEVNPNPSLYQLDGFNKAAKLVGMEYSDLLEEIINLAARRYNDKKTFYNKPIK